MCGIVGVIGDREAAPILLDGLRRLEYRGYDSAGVALLSNGGFALRRAEGKLERLEALVKSNPPKGTVGIGHTRWATHGRPSETNAHPHATTRVAVVHNGIIENYQHLKAELSAAGHNFETETDTEVVPHLVHHYLEQGLDPEAAVEKTLKRLEGAFALGILFAGRHDLVIGARRGSPLAIGFNQGETMLASDALALAPFTRKVAYLEEGDWAVLRRDCATFRDEHGHEVERAIRETAHDGLVVAKGNYRHFMQKEIHEQPAVIGETLNGYYDPAAGAIRLPEMPFALEKVERLTIVACGTSYFAGLIARYWIETLARVPVEVDIASEFRYRQPPLQKGGAALFISQSGETADTLAALRFAKSSGQHVISLVNVSESTIARGSDVVLRTLAGAEIGVASTKAFTCQLTALACFAIALARAKGAISAREENRLTQALAEVPARATEVLRHDQALEALAESLRHASDVIYIGRGTGYPVALEGALKLKEISYIHAEGFAAGELKHGPIALIDGKVPVIVVAPPDALFDKTVSNMQEVIARGARVVFLSDAEGIKRLGRDAQASIEMPKVDPFVAPILYTIPVQLIAYHVAVLKGTDVDQPRNLAKSVTVE
ncbi:MAG: glutamine--fructose-6-phosphate transaminase (isomerizing) [Alphaproteobacteria bacterium]|nr:glutamine--fructose-6-phosphate transaminase (isomerizing) [Alphaproteobacteria bacterium]